MVSPKGRTLLFTSLFCFYLTLPFNAKGDPSQAAATNAEQNAAENQSATNQSIARQPAASANGPQQKPEENQPSVAPPACSPAPGPNTSDAAAQQPRGAYESATVLRVTTRLVMTDVVATDSHGRHVLDLESKDFTVLEDGKQQSVRLFGLQRPRTLAELKTAALPILPANVFTNIPRFRLDNSLNVILLDALNTSLINQADVRRKMLHCIQTLPNDSPTAVFLLGQKLRMVQDFTTDPNILQEAVDKAEHSPSALLDNPLAGGEADYYPPVFLGAAAAGASRARKVRSRADQFPNRFARSRHHAGLAIDRALAGRIPGKKKSDVDF